jgi:hypothetical protein
MTCPEAVGEIIKVMIVYWRQQHHARPLDYLVLKAWFADRSLLTSLLINPHPFNRRCFIAMASQSVVKITQIVFKVSAYCFAVTLSTPGALLCECGDRLPSESHSPEDDTGC